MDSNPGQDAASNGKYPNPYTLVTNDDAQALPGAPLKTKGAYAADPYAHGAGCTWDTGASVLNINDGDPAVLGALAKAMGKPMSGLGDEAFAALSARRRAATCGATARSLAVSRRR